MPAVAAPRAQREGHLRSKALAFPSLFISCACCAPRGSRAIYIIGSEATAQELHVPAHGSQPFFPGAPFPSLEHPLLPWTIHPFPRASIPSSQEHSSFLPLALLPSLKHSSLFPWNTQPFPGAPIPSQEHPSHPLTATAPNLMDPYPLPRSGSVRFGAAARAEPGHGASTCRHQPSAAGWDLSGKNLASKDR